MNPATILSAIVAIIRGVFSAPRREPAFQVVPVEPRSAEALQRKAVRLGGMTIPLSDHARRGESGRE